MKRKLSFDEIDQIKSLDQMKLNRSKAPSVFGVGVNDVDFCVKVDGVDCRQYKLWHALIRRCYDANYHELRPTYIGCSIAEEWKCFSNFLVWCNNQAGYKMKDINGRHFPLDKDVINKNNKTYSSEGCSFVPQIINSILVKCDSKRGCYPVGVSFCKRDRRYISFVSAEGNVKNLGRFNTVIEAFQAYKNAKEAECKRLANLYKDVIQPAVYEALMTYTVEIDD